MDVGQVIGPGVQFVFFDNRLFIGSVIGQGLGFGCVPAVATGGHAGIKMTAVFPEAKQVVARWPGPPVARLHGTDGPGHIGIGIALRPDALPVGQISLSLTATYATAPSRTSQFSQRAARSLRDVVSNWPRNCPT